MNTWFVTFVPFVIFFSQFIIEHIFEFDDFQK
uniref:Uncharacterized protein n=1 Tax=Siphoviridae sp. ctPAi1 TaxID=2826320 RepID=A0A8S5M7R7_9CAUD|nr:MAG TPA: hypothetical protein [Siphoviridae sp. ctPAi1]